jgi:V/A-type H+-transporting ATPase subunit I
MALVSLVKTLVVGVYDARPLAEDAISALRCFEVVNVEQEDYHFLIEGWLPQSWMQEFQVVLEEVSQGSVAVIYEEDVTAVITTAPTALRNRPRARPYEFLTELYGMPGRNDYDPTFATFVFMPLFFGLMIGDAGYGLVLIPAAWLLGRYFRTPLAELAQSLLTYGGLWSIAFGLLLFGEFFAWPLQPILPWYPYLHRSHDFFLLFVLAVIVGATHMNIGLILGFRSVRRRQGLRIAFLRKMSWIVLEHGAFVLMLGFAGFVSGTLWYLGFGVLAAGIALLALGGSLTDVVEVPSFISNLLSYLRLAVYGIANSALGGTLNEAVTNSLLPRGPPGWVAAAILLIIGHGFLLVLAVAMVGLQALRLHYVEFYSKFYSSEAGRTGKFAPSVKAPPSRSAM